MAVSHFACAITAAAAADYHCGLVWQFAANFADCGLSFSYRRHVDNREHVIHPRARAVGRERMNTHSPSTELQHLNLAYASMFAKAAVLPKSRSCLVSVECLTKADRLFCWSGVLTCSEFGGANLGFATRGEKGKVCPSSLEYRRLYPCHRSETASFLFIRLELCPPLFPRQVCGL